MLLAFDLDNTIVTYDYQLPGTIENSIQRARAAGHAVAVLTGRARASALLYLEQLKLKGPYGVNNGALVVGSEGEILKQVRIAASEVQALVDYVDSSEIEFCCMLDDILFVRDPDHHYWTWAHTQNRAVVALEAGAAPAADKVVFGGDGASALLGRVIAERYPQFVAYEWTEGYLEVTGRDADKGMALELIADHLGFVREEVVAFGDGINDVTMLSWAGHGVAVGPHAHPGVRAVAGEHIPAPERNGVAEWLEANLLGPR